MVEVAGEPLLTHVFETLLEAGVDELVVIVGYEMEGIVSHYGDEFRGIPITYAHQREQKGLAHAVLQAEPHVDGQFVVLNGDNVFADGIGPAVERASEPEVDAALLVEEVSPEAARDTGVVEVEGDRVTGVIEKAEEPPSTLATTGCYVLPAEVFAAIRLLRPSERGEYELTDAVGVLVRAGSRIEAVQYGGQRWNVNKPADIQRAAGLLKE
jgi:glucose-1-phosphate thymidylyltransferase